MNWRRDGWTGGETGKLEERWRLVESSVDWRRDG